MFYAKLAGITIQVDHRYEAVQKQFGDFITNEDAEPAFRVAAAEDECRAESVVPAYGEEICLCRKICTGLLTQNVLMIHAAAIEKNGAGYLFAGKSGIGKTTHIRLWQKVFGSDARVINGDKPLLRFEADGLMIHGSPWQGKERLGCNASVPAKALCFLEQASENRLVRIRAEEALERLFHQVLLPDKAAEMDKLLTLMEKILLQLPCYLLYCRPDEQAAQVAWEGLKEADGC